MLTTELHPNVEVGDEGRVLSGTVMRGAGPLWASIMLPPLKRTA